MFGFGLYCWLGQFVLWIGRRVCVFRVFVLISGFVLLWCFVTLGFDVACVRKFGVVIWVARSVDLVVFKCFGFSDALGFPGFWRSGFAGFLGFLVVWVSW